MSEQKHMGGLEWILLIVLSILWGGSFFFNGVVVGALPTFTIVLARVGIGAAGLWCLISILGQRMPRSGAIWLAFLGMGVLNNVIPFALFVWGQASIASGLASIINATTPMFSVLAAHVLTPGERLTPARLAGATLGVLGVSAMMGFDLILGDGGSVLAQLACVGAAVSYALAAIYGRRFVRMGVGPMQTATGQVTASTLVLLIPVLALERPWMAEMPSATVWSALLGLGLVCTSLAYLIFFRILARSGATNLLLVTLLIPVSAIWLGVAFLGETLALHQAVGMGLIGAGLLLIDGRILKAR